MCLTCAYNRQTVKEKENLFQYSKNKTYLHTQDNRVIKLNEEQIQEIIDNAYYVLCTGVDMSCSIWAIQWKNDYKVQTIDLTKL